MNGFGVNFVNLSPVFAILAAYVICVIYTVKHWDAQQKGATRKGVNLRKLTKNTLTKETKFHTLSMINEQHLSK